MSKYLDQKKESIVRVNRIIDDLQSTQDVTEILEKYKNKYEKLLKKYEHLNEVFEFHKGIIQNISSCIATIDSKGKITFMNKSALDLIGYKTDEILGKSFNDLFEDKSEGTIITEQFISLKKMFESRETNLIAKDGKIIPIGFSTTPLVEEDEAARMALFLSSAI